MHCSTDSVEKDLKRLTSVKQNLYQKMIPKKFQAFDLSLLNAYVVSVIILTSVFW